MKKRLLFPIISLAVCLALFLPSSAAGRCFNWYCAHVKEHQRPTIGRELAFVEDLEAYFLDRDAENKVVYLTFDAGYENGNVERILDILQQEDVRAAFFILGNLVTRNTELVKRMVDEGHTVCNHTLCHKDMSQCDDESFLRELKEMEDLYLRYVGEKMAPYYRPPEGRFSRENIACAAENGYRTIFWSFAYPDWDNEKQMAHEKAKSMILDNVHNGEVMLLHPTSSTNAAILGDVIRTLKEEGYRFGTLDELTRAEQ